MIVATINFGVVDDTNIPRILLLYDKYDVYYSTNNTTKTTTTAAHAATYFYPPPSSPPKTTMKIPPLPPDINNFGVVTMITELNLST